MIHDARGDLVAIIPAAGQARRLGALPGSKELLPIGVRDSDDGPTVRVACHELLDRLRVGGVRRAYVVLHTGKWDLARYLAAGDEVGIPLAHVVVRESRSLPESLDRAYPFVAGCRVALGFPDVLFTPEDGFALLARRQAETGADLVLGLFPTDRPQTTDMVACDGDGRVTAIEVRPPATRLTHAWLIAVWGPRFTEHLHDEVAAALRRGDDGGGELQIGAVVASALAAGLDLRGVELPGARYRDLGTPAALAATLSGEPL